MRSRAASATCSGCGQRSSRVHWYYQRTLADRPVAGRRVRVELRARRLVCGNEDCARRTFAEQIPALTRRHARRTDALTAHLTDVALFLGGQPGARLFRTFAQSKSLSTATPSPPAPPRTAPPGSTTTSATAGAPTPSLSSASTAWPAQAATSTPPRPSARASSWRPRRTYRRCWPPSP
ncbi:transposase family protein [Streptomyces sp. NPDC048337]|uniref:transposase family protein n=1 Tax=Streptomyces sp. NPDC048337 TaxID=3365535 RepID=UPI00371D319B